MSRRSWQFLWFPTNCFAPGRAAVTLCYASETVHTIHNHTAASWRVTGPWVVAGSRFRHKFLLQDSLVGWT